jgi:hypothetical protein
MPSGSGLRRFHSGHLQPAVLVTLDEGLLVPLVNCKYIEKEGVRLNFQILQFDSQVLVSALRTPIHHILELACLQVNLARSAPSVLRHSSAHKAVPPHLEANLYRDSDSTSPSYFSIQAQQTAFNREFTRLRIHNSYTVKRAVRSLQSSGPTQT